MKIKLRRLLFQTKWQRHDDIRSYWLTVFKLSITHKNFLLFLREFKLNVTHFPHFDHFPFHFQDKNTAQTDEEKQRERQRNEREIKNAEIEAQNIKVKPIFKWVKKSLVFYFLFTTAWTRCSGSSPIRSWNSCARASLSSGIKKAKRSCRQSITSTHTIWSTL